MLYKLLKEIIGAEFKDSETFDGTDGAPPLKDTTSSVGVDNAVGGFKNDPVEMAVCQEIYQIIQ